MLLTCDIGNTNVKLAVYEDGKQVTFQLLDTKTTDFKSFILSFLYKANIRETMITDSIVASVVPSVTGIVIEALKAITMKAPVVIDANNFYGIEVVDSMREECGADILVMCAFAYQKLKRELLVVSLGTATVICHVTANGVFSHCILAPGYETLASTLYNNAAKLPEFSATKKDSFLVSNTIDAMSVGVVEGYIGMVRYLINSVKRELKNKDMVVIGCGGAGKSVAKYIPELSAYDPDLVTTGLNFIFNTYIKK